MQHHYLYNTMGLAFEIFLSNLTFKTRVELVWCEMFKMFGRQKNSAAFNPLSKHLTKRTWLLSSPFLFSQIPPALLFLNQSPFMQLKVTILAIGVAAKCRPEGAVHKWNSFTGEGEFVQKWRIREIGGFSACVIMFLHSPKITHIFSILSECP